MFERFTDRARRVLVLAQEEARQLDHDFIGTEHVLLGLLAEGEGVAAKALTELGYKEDDLRRRVTELIGRGVPSQQSGAPPFTPRSKQAMEYALREALQLGHNYIGTEHLLLALIRVEDGVAAKVLREAGVGLGEVRNKVIQLLSGFTAGRPATWDSTNAAKQLTQRVRSHAGEEGSRMLASYHYLLAIFDDAESVAAKVLASFGVTAEGVKQKVLDIGIAGSTDEHLLKTPIDVGDGLKLVVDDLNLAERIRKGEVEVVVRERDQKPQGES